MSTHRVILRRIGTGVAAASVAVALAAVLTGCQKQPEPPAKETPLPVKSAPLKPGPGETASSSLMKKDEAPPYVKVKRDKDGRYTWDISGKDVDEIIRTDRRLRRSLGDGREKGK